MPRSIISSLLRGPADADSESDVVRRRRLLNAELLPEAFSNDTKPGGRLKQLRVGIVGGGLAGLTAAWFLQECGVGEVTVFEQLDRVGGRVHTDHTLIPGKLAERGAELIGSNHLLWLELADRFGLVLNPVTPNKSYLPDRPQLRLDGRDLSPDEIKKLRDGLIPHLNIIGDEARPISPDIPWTHPVAHHYDGMSVADKLDEIEGLEPLERKAIEFTLENNACAPVEFQSYLGLLALISAARTGDDDEGMRGYWTSSEDFRCKQGNQALADRLVDKINAGSGTVHTSSVVLRIDIIDEAAAMISTGDGSVHHVDRVVLAVPAPQWPQIAIEPPLPASQFEMAHGPAVKYISVYGDDGPDWPGGGRAPSAEWDELGNVWETTDAQQPVGPPRGLTVFSGGPYILPSEADYTARLAQLFPDITPSRTEFVDWRDVGYSVPLMGQVTTVGERLSRPFAGVLRVAGEQASMGFYGYMEGALQSGARAAGALLRDVLGSTKPTTSSTGLCLPLGHSPGDSRAQRDRCEELARELDRGTEPFAGDRVDQSYSMSEDAPGHLRSIHNLWLGAVDEEGGFVTVEMLTSVRMQLGSLLGEDTPIPVRAIYGPVKPATAGGKIITGKEIGAGVELGTLAGSDFTIRFQDQDGFHLQPLAVLDAFDRVGLWSDTGGLRCPLLPEPDGIPPMAVAGPNPAASGTPYLVLSGGSRGWTVHCPPAEIPPRYLSFLSNEPITISLATPSQSGTARLTIHDITDSAYRTLAPNPVEIALDGAHIFVPETTLQPHHLPYPEPSSPPKPEDSSKLGRRVPSPPLTYEINVDMPDGTQATTTISQDVPDIIRQEYRFHTPPFQKSSSRTRSIVVPDRKHVERASRPRFASHFTPEEFAHSHNYAPPAASPKNSYMLNGAEMFQVAEYLRDRYIEHIALRRAEDPNAIPDTVTPALNVGSNWRNPERNENVGGVVNSNHQFGFALDMDPPQKMGTTIDIELLQCLFAAAGDFLRELVRRNGVAAFGKVEIFLEHKPQDILWEFEWTPDGTVLDVPGRDYKPAWGAPPSLAAAAAHATHVHVAWAPARLDRRLELPPVRAEVPLPVPVVFRNVILIASEDAKVPIAEQLPLDHLANTLKAYLQDIDPQTPTDIHVVSDAIGWLRPLQAFHAPEYKIRRLFSFSHAWPGGLDLEHFHNDPNYDEYIHKPAILERLTQIYDPKPFAESSNELLPTGSDDLRTVKTNQIRISNLVWLPPVVKARLRRAFEESEGVYIAGCRTAQEDGIPHPPFCAALANVLDRPVRGANYYSKVFTAGSDGQWEEKDITRGGDPPEQPIVLVPGSYGRGQLLGFVMRYGLPPQHPDFSPTSDLLEIYESFLNPVHPEEP